MSRTSSTGRLARAVVAWSILAALGGPVASGQGFRPDAVEALKQVLADRKRYDPRDYLLEGKASTDKVAAALANYRKRLEETTAPDQLRTAAELGAALLLNGWEPVRLDQKAKEEVDRARRLLPYKEFREAVGKIYAREQGGMDYYSKVRTLEFDARKKLSARLARALRKELKEGSPSRKVATCNLILEMMTAAIGQLDDPLPLYDEITEEAAEPLRELLASESSPVAVRSASARALGRFHTAADKSWPTLKAALAPSTPEIVRQAAADGLEGLIHSALGIERLKGSEPGVSVREARRTSQRLPAEVIRQVAAGVAAAAAGGIEDSSATVRRQCGLALQESAGVLLQVMGDSIPATLPKALPGERAELELPISEIAPVMQAFAANGKALLAAFFDPDARVRYEARRTLESLARARGLLKAAREAGYTIVDPVEERLKMLDREDLERLKKLGRAAVRPAVVPVAFKAAPPPEWPARKQLDDAEAALNKMLAGLIDKITDSGFTDPDARSRRAAVEAAEALGPLAEPFIPRLAKATADSDSFVRWIAARALGTLGKRPDVVLPALAANFNDDDLDARIAAITAAGKFGSAASSLVPALAERLGKGDAEVRIAAMRTLAKIGAEASGALPALAELFTHPDPRVRGAPATLVGRFESKARPYLEALRKLVDDPDTDVRGAASGAILAID